MKLYLGSTVLLVTLISQCTARYYGSSNIINNWLGGDGIGAHPPSFCKSNECPKFTVVDKQDTYELRKYEEAYWTSTNILGVDMKKAGNQAFHRLYDYITGDNVDGVTIDMTVPVINRVIPGEGPLCDNNFTYSFYVPSKYQDSGPPAPTNPDVYTNILPEFSAYVRQFGGRFETAAQWISEADALLADLEKAGLRDTVDQTFFYTASYNSPFELFNRHNEIWFFVKSVDAASGGNPSDEENGAERGDNKLRFTGY